MSKKALKEVNSRTLELAQKRMEWAIGFMVVRYHFVYQMLAMMTKQMMPNLGTIGVCVLSGGNFRLVYDPAFVLELSDPELTYVLYHEILHLVLHHCTSRQFTHKEIANLAHDLAANEIIPVIHGSCEQPMGENKGMYVSELKKMKEYTDILEKQTSEWYYDYLMKRAKKIGAGGTKKGESGKGFDDHGGWKEDEIATEKIRAKISEINKNDQWGDIGSTEKELILAAQVRRINWRNILRQFYGSHIMLEHEGTRKRPNRRTGYIHPGARRIMLDRHLVAVDTSGSIDPDLLAEFLAVINQMTEYLPIDIMQCDCGVTELPRPFNRKKCEFEFKGRGGTDFNPIMNVVNEQHYKSVVVLTDGQAGECLKPNAEVVWVLPANNNPPVEWGKRIHMTRHV
jgi:predicted metal-dependent peptidase